MIRGTTPTIILNLSTSVDLSEVKEMWVTLKSALKEKTFEKSELTIQPSSYSVSLTLSQEDTLEFSAGDVRVQVRFLMNNGRAYASNIKQLRMDEILKDGVIE